MKNETEVLFVKCVLAKLRDPTVVVVYPTREQDMFEHWDCEVGGVKYDVKARKRINRKDDVFTDDIHVELFNVNGDDGWVKGLADYIAFEQDGQFLVVHRAHLLKFTELNVKDELGKGFYQKHTRPYSRDGSPRKDVVVLVPLKDVKQLKHTIVEKI